MSEIGIDFSKAPKASEVIAALQKLIAEHGDLPVCVDDADTHWRLPFGITREKVDVFEGLPERFEITTDYYGDPDGLVGEAK